jgi:Ras-related GTP-binding protein C/D
MLQVGRRRTNEDGSYSGPARQGPVRHLSKASLKLERVHEQNRLAVQKNQSKDGRDIREEVRAPIIAPGPAARGKPRLLLMGQRR